MMKVRTAKNGPVTMRGIFLDPNKVWMLAYGWSSQKRDWWYDKDPSTAKFFDIRRSSSSESIRYGIYIGRLAIVLMKNKKNS